VAGGRLSRIPQGVATGTAGERHRQDEAAAQHEGSLHFAPHHVIEGAGALERPDLAQATDRSVVDEDVGQRLASREVRQPGAQSGVAGRSITSKR